MSVVLRFSGLSALLFFVSSPARADDVAKLTSKLSSAAGAVTSFVIHMQMTGTTGVGGTLTFVRPQSVKSEMRMGQLTVESYFIDGVAYIHNPTGGWQKMTVVGTNAPQQSMNIADALKSAQVTLLPDRREHGATVGVIQIDRQPPVAPESPLAQAAQHLVCSYDKTSYLMKTCANAGVTITYEKYNDPANVVVLPPEAKDAAPMVIWTPSTPAPGRSGSPDVRGAPVPALAATTTPASAGPPNPVTSP